MNFLNNNNNLGLVLIIVLVLIVLLVVMIFVSKKNKESFATTSWGFVPESPAPFISDNSNRDIVGPDPGSNSITGWQYNPQSTLVGYDFYQENRDLASICKDKKMDVPINTLRTTQKIAPLSNGEVGILTNPTYQIIKAVDKDTTRVPSSFSSQNQYVIPNPTTEPQLIGPSVNYEW